MMSVGTSIFLRSSVKSVLENALMQSSTALKPGLHPLQPERLPQALRHRSAQPVGPVQLEYSAQFHGPDPGQVLACHS
jgi:hypothetical protein